MRWVRSSIGAVAISPPRLRSDCCPGFFGWWCYARAFIIALLGCHAFSLAQAIDLGRNWSGRQRNLGNQWSRLTETWKFHLLTWWIGSCWYLVGWNQYLTQKIRKVAKGEGIWNEERVESSSTMESNLCSADNVGERVYRSDWLW